MNILFQKFAATHQKKKIVKGHLGNWCAMPLEHNEKRLEIINLCWIPSSSSTGECCSCTQHVIVDKKVKTIAEHRKETLQGIKNYARRNEDITDVVIAGDYNLDVRDNAMRKFYADIGAIDVHTKINNIEMNQMDKTSKLGLKPIDSFAASAGILDYVEGSMTFDFNKIFETDHRGYLVDVGLDEYFELEFSG